MKTYLNKNERQTVTLICVMFAKVQEILEANNGSKEEMKALKYSHTYLRKYIEELVKRVGYDEGGRICREARDSNVLLKPKSYEDGQQLVDKQAMEGIAEKCLNAYCFGCTREDWRNCELCKYMRKLSIDTIYGFEDRCMYWYPEGGFDPDYTEDKE